MSPRHSTRRNLLLSPSADEHLSPVPSHDVVDKPFSTIRTQEAQAAFSHTCLKDCVFFAGRDPAFLQRLMGELHVELFNSGDIVVKEGDVGDTLYILGHGEVEVLAGPGQARVATLGHGSVFGELAMLGVSRKRTATVRALDFCDCRIIQRASFWKVLRAYPQEEVFFGRMALDRKNELQLVKAAERLSSRRSSTVQAQAAAVAGKVADEMPRRVSAPPSLVAQPPPPPPGGCRLGFRPARASFSGAVQPHSVMLENTREPPLQFLSGPANAEVRSSSSTASSGLSDTKDGSRTTSPLLSGGAYAPSSLGAGGSPRRAEPPAASSFAPPLPAADPREGKLPFASAARHTRLWVHHLRCGQRQQALEASPGRGGPPMTTLVARAWRQVLRQSCSPCKRLGPPPSSQCLQASHNMPLPGLPPCTWRPVARNGLVEAYMSKANGFDMPSGLKSLQSADPSLSEYASLAAIA